MFAYHHEEKVNLKSKKEKIKNKEMKDILASLLCITLILGILVLTVPTISAAVESDVTANFTHELLLPPGETRISTMGEPKVTTTNPCEHGFIDFEEGTDRAVIHSTIHGVKFTTTAGQDWLYGDWRTGEYNGKYPDGAYTSNGNFFAWLGENQGYGRIDFTEGNATYLSLLTSTYSGVTIDAYDSDDNLLASSGWAGNNINTGEMTRLNVSAPDMAYVIVHDTGNYWLIDDICTDAGGVRGVNLNISTDKMVYSFNETVNISAEVTDAYGSCLYPLHKDNFTVYVDGIEVDIEGFMELSCTEYKLVIKAPQIVGDHTIGVNVDTAPGSEYDSTGIKVYTIGNVYLTAEGNRLTQYENSADTPIYRRNDDETIPAFNIEVEIIGVTPSEFSEVEDNIRVFVNISDYTRVKDPVKPEATAFACGPGNSILYYADWKSPDDSPVGKYNATAEVEDLNDNLLAYSDKKHFYLIFKLPANKEDFLTKESTCGLVKKKYKEEYIWTPPYYLHQYDSQIWKPALEKITGEISIINSADKLTTFAHNIGDYGYCYPKNPKGKKNAWFEDSLKFIKEKPSDIECSDGTKKRRSGVCIDFAMLGISYFTSVGIPTRPVSGWYLNPVENVGHTYAEIYDESYKYDNWQDYWHHSDPGWNRYEVPGANVGAGYQWDPLKTKRDSLECNCADEDRRQYYNYFATINNDNILDKGSYDYGDPVDFTTDVTNTGMLDIRQPLYMRASLTPTLPLICGPSQTDTLKICNELDIDDQAHETIGLHLPDNGNIRNQLCKKIVHWEYRAEVYFNGAKSKDVVLDIKKGDVPGMCGSFEPSLIIDNISTVQLGIMNSTEVIYNNITNESTYRFILSDNLTANIEYKIKYNEQYTREIWNILNSDYDKKHTYALVTPLLGIGDSVYIPGYGAITANLSIDVSADYIVIYNTTVGTNGSVDIYAFSKNMTLKDVTLFNGVVKVVGMQNCTLASESGESFLTYLSTRNGSGMSFNLIYNDLAQQIVSNGDTLTQFFIEGEHEQIYYYKVGDTVYVNTTISNNGILAETRNLSLTITEPGFWNSENIIYNATETMIIPAKSEAEVTFQYQIPDNPQIGKHRIIVSDDITKATTIFMIQAPFNVTFDVPATIAQAEEFYVNATIANALDISLSGINVTIELPNDFNTSENLTKNIRTLLSGESANVSWLVNATDFEYGYAPITIYMNSVEGINDTAVTSLIVLRLPELKIFPSAPPEAQINTSFDFKANVTNEGDLNLSGVSVNLSLPDNVTTTDNLTKLIGDLAGGETKSVNWTITAMRENDFWIEVNGCDVNDTYCAYATELINIVKPEIELDLVNPVEVIINQSFSVIAKIKNIGELNASQVKVNLSLPPEFETVNDTFVNIGNLSIGQTKEVEWTLQGVNPGYGEITVNVTLSGDVSITKGVIVTCFPLSAETDKNIYMRGENVTITSNTTNENPEVSYIDLVMNVTIQGPGITETYDRPIVYIGSLETQNATFTWDTTGKPLGDYIVTSRIMGSPRVLSEASTSFTVELLETDLPNVELLYADPTVTSINVTGLNLSEINETYKPEGITSRYAYMINSTGAGNFTLRFTNITNADMITVYKINETNQWVELDGITTEDTVTFTMEVGDPPVVFGSREQIPPAQVPTLTPIGITALAGFLTVVAVSRIRKKK